ncbi:MAG TPA: hypothetical protein VL494_22210 [Steroidobacteraceae bacterium]|jgi:hypothetical protein|nr:hypothetical protein [Steroidobacteraceae bacterium]
MNVRNLLYVLAILFATTAISADNKSAASGAAKEQPPPHATCLNQCAANEQRCSRDVRHARTQCQKVAANGGRDVFTGRPATTSNGSGSRYESDNGIDYGAFCYYFANPNSSCGSGYYSSACQQRLAYRHGICLDRMSNVAQLRYDCYRTERDANTQCRDDLRDCKLACE